VVLGEPASALVQAVRDEGADLLVVGSHGRTGLTKLLLGSVSAHAVGHAPCSVLVVKRAPGPAGSEVSKRRVP
jgi:nucleotide-binding universal stress UspA family protein